MRQAIAHAVTKIQPRAVAGATPGSLERVGSLAGDPAIDWIDFSPEYSDKCIDPSARSGPLTRRHHELEVGGGGTDMPFKTPERRPKGPGIKLVMKQRHQRGRVDHTRGGTQRGKPRSSYILSIL